MVTAFGAALAFAQPVVVPAEPADVFELRVAAPALAPMPASDFFDQAVPAPAPPAPPVPPVGPGPHIFTIGPANGSYLGIGAQEIDAERAKELKLPEPRGVEVTRVEEDSPAAKAGLKQGDVVLQYNGQRVEGTEQFVRLVRETPPGRQVTLQISRNGAIQTITAAVGERKDFVYRRNFGVGPEIAPDMEKLREELGRMQLDPKFHQDMARLQAELGAMRLRMPDMPEPLMAWRSPVLGIEAEALTSQLAEFFGVKQGVLVRSVAKDSAAEKAGIKAGDVIVRVDNQEVSTPSGLSRRVRELDSRSSFPVTVVRNRQEVVLNVIPEKRPARPQGNLRRVPERSSRPRVVRVGNPFAASPIL
jgi:serine protease Do